MVEPQLLTPYTIQSHYSALDIELTSSEADHRAAYARAHKTVTYNQDPSYPSLTAIALIAGAVALPTLAILSLQA